MRAAGSSLVELVSAIVVVEVRQARALVSPAYDDGTVTEADVIRTFQARFARLRKAAAS
jgi:hypothetical protein